jgi:hypothetical protein
MGIPGNQPCWGLPRFVRAGGLRRSLIQAGQNPYRLAPYQSSKVPVKATDRRGIHDAEPRLEVPSVRLPPSEASLSRRSGANRR